MNKKLKISKYIIISAILTLISVFFLIIYNSYQNLVDPQDMIEKEETVNPFNSTIDMTVIDEIKARKEYP